MKEPSLEFYTPLLEEIRVIGMREKGRRKDFHSFFFTQMPVGVREDSHRHFLDFCESLGSARPQIIVSQATYYREREALVHYRDSPGRQLHIYSLFVPFPQLHPARITKYL